MFVMTRSNGVRSAISAPPFSTHASSAGVSSYGFSASEKPSDVISTGGSLKAMEALVHKAGGEVVAKIAVLAEGGAADRKDIMFLGKLPVFNADGSIKG